MNRGSLWRALDTSSPGISHVLRFLARARAQRNWEQRPDGSDRTVLVCPSCRPCPSCSAMPCAAHSGLRPGHRVVTSPDVGGRHERVPPPSVAAYPWRVGHRCRGCWPPVGSRRSHRARHLREFQLSVWCGVNARSSGRTPERPEPLGAAVPPCPLRKHARNGGATSPKPYRPLPSADWARPQSVSSRASLIGAETIQA